MNLKKSPMQEQTPLNPKNKFGFKNNASEEKHDDFRQKLNQSR